MKKTLIALALTTISTAAMADVVLYGQIKGGVEVSKQKGVDGTVTNIVDYGSKIGFKGQEQLNGNLKAIWQLEQDVNIGGGKDSKGQATGFGTRDSFVGLSGDFGTVKAGYQETPVKALNGRLDEWEYSSDAAGLGVFTRGTDAASRRVSASYETPNMGGFSAKAYVSPSDNNNPPASNATSYKQADSAVYGLSASYENAGVFADVAGTFVRSGDGNPPRYSKQRGYQALAQVGYENDKVLGGVAYQYSHNVDSEEVGGENIDRLHEVALTGIYKVDDALRLKASAAVGLGGKVWNTNQKDKAWGNGKYYQGIVGADYALSKRTVVNGQVGYMQFGNSKNDEKGGTVSVGMSHKF